MTQEEKQLLLKDLCARLPYGVEVFYNTTIPFATLITINAKKADCIVYDHSEWDRHSKFQIEEIKPYLRSMSSMTEEEYNKYELTFDNVVVYSGHNNNNIHSEHRATYETFDYLNSIHVDYRDLIEKGLALEAPKDMYKF